MCLIAYWSKQVPPKSVIFSWYTAFLKLIRYINDNYIPLYKTVSFNNNILGIIHHKTLPFMTHLLLKYMQIDKKALKENKKEGGPNDGTPEEQISLVKNPSDPNV